MYPRAHRRTALLVLAGGWACALAAGCSGEQSALSRLFGAGPPAESAPAANSAANAVKRFEWAIDHRDVDAIETMLTDDFQFITAGTDSAGNPAGVAWTRDTFIAALRGFLVGSIEHGPAESIALLLDRNLIEFPDTRPGKDPKWHKQVRTHLDLKVKIDSASTEEVTGSLRFFATRGDSAAIPQDLKARGFKPDSTSWWLDRLEDETLSGAGLPRTKPLPSKSMSFTSILAYYLRF